MPQRDDVTVPVSRPVTTRRRRKAHSLARHWLIRHPSIFLLKTVAVMVPVMLLCLGLLYLRLQQGPISLKFLVTPIERSVNGELAGLKFAIEDAIVQLAPSGAVQFRLKGVKLTQEDGDVVAHASLASLELSTAALLSFRLAPSRLDLIQPRILLFDNDTSPIALSYGRALQEHGTRMPTQAGRDTPVSAPPRAIPPRQTLMPKTRVINRHRIDLGRVLAQASSRMRRREGAASYLETLGLRDASLLINADGHQSVLQLLEVALTARHGQHRSFISGEGRIASGGHSFGFAFRTVDSEKDDTLTTEVSIDGLVPRTLARYLPALHPAASIDVPISGNGTLGLSRQGDVRSAAFDISIGAGELRLPWLGHVPLALTSGHVRMRFAGDTQRITLEPSTLEWRGSRVQLRGGAEPFQAKGGETAWRIALQGIDGVLAAEDLKSKALPLERLEVRAVVDRQRRLVQVERFGFRAGGADVSMTGSVEEIDGERKALLDGRIGTMRIAALKAMWPRGLAPQTREWVSNHLVTGTIKGGSFRIADVQAGNEGVMSAGAQPGRQLSLTLEGEDMALEYLKGLPPLEAPRALLRVDGTTAELTIPDASIAADARQRIHLRAGRLTVTDVDKEQPAAELSMKVQGPMAALFEILDREPVNLTQYVGTKVSGLDGKLAGDITVRLPLRSGISLSDVLIQGKARITDGSARNVVGPYAMQGATINVVAQDHGVQASGEMLLGGVLAKIDWQRMLGAPEDAQPPLRVRAKLGNAERAQLGLDIDDLVQGDVPLELTLQTVTGGDPKVQIVADLTGAELTLRDIAWSKPAGRQASLQFEVAKGRAGQVMLKNFRVIGDSIAIDGWVALGPDNQPVEYLFPQFSLNTASNMHVQGVLRPNRIWDVKARGTTYDGADYFRSLITFTGHQAVIQARHPAAGIDLVAHIDTVQGVGEATLKSVQLRLQKRNKRLTALDFRGTHRNGRPLTARLEEKPGAPRMLVVEADDAGSALQLAGLYSKMAGGRGRLELSLDGHGAVEKAGVLTIHRFKVLGDPVVSEVLYTPDAGQPAIQGTLPRRRGTVYQEFDFDRLRAPFLIGNGQLVIDNAQVTGPLIGATLRGKLDFRSNRMQLGGTYIPLSELNRALSAVPIFGQLITGPRGEGVLGITFAIQGSMSNPQVIPNPFSMVAPGIFREIFQMTPENPTVTPGPIKSQKSKSVSPQIRATPTITGPDSMAQPQQPGAAPARTRQPKVIDGWSAQGAPDPAATRP